MNPMIATLAQLQRLRDRKVQDITVQLAEQQQLCARYDSNINALSYLFDKTQVNSQAAPSVEVLKNVTDYKGSLQRVIAWQEQEKTLAKIKANRIQKNLVRAACEEKIVALTLDDQRQTWRHEQQTHAQKSLDEIASQCWLRQRQQPE